MHTEEAKYKGKEEHLQGRLWRRDKSVNISERILKWKQQQTNSDIESCRLISPAAEILSTFHKQNKIRRHYKIQTYCRGFITYVREPIFHTWLNLNRARKVLEKSTSVSKSLMLDHWCFFCVCFHVINAKGRQDVHWKPAEPQLTVIVSID